MDCLCRVIWFRVSINTCSRAGRSAIHKSETEKIVVTFPGHPTFTNFTGAPVVTDTTHPARRADDGRSGAAGFRDHVVVRIAPARGEARLNFSVEPRSGSQRPTPATDPDQT